jgi:hypothetical protein
MSCPEAGRSALASVAAVRPLRRTDVAAERRAAGSSSGTPKTANDADYGGDARQPTGSIGRSTNEDFIAHATTLPCSIAGAFE